MKKPQMRLVNSALARWLQCLQRFRFLVLGGIFLALCGSIYMVVNHLGMNTDTLNMLSDKLSWRQKDAEFKAQFPELSGSILVIVTAPSPDQARAAARHLHQVLPAESETIEAVSYDRDLPFFKQTWPLFLSRDELGTLSDRLIAMQPLLSILARDPSLTEFFSLLSQVLDGDDLPLHFDREPVLEEIDEAVVGAMQNRSQKFSWQRLLDPELEQKEFYREYLLVRPRSDYTSWLSIQGAVKALERHIRPLEQEGVTVTLTGSPMLEYQEMRDVQRGSVIAAIISIILVIATLWWGIRSLRLVGVILINLFVGLVLTAGFAAIAVGTLNMISVAFVVLYIGLGVDFSVHMCLRFREHMQQGLTANTAIYRAVIEDNAAILLCALTTIVGFYAFLLTDYIGVAELGLISGTGMMINFVLNVTLTPILLSLLYRNAPSEKVIVLPSTGHVTRFIASHTMQIKWIVLLVFLGAIWSTQWVRFDRNPLNLQNASNSAIVALRQLIEEGEENPLSAQLLVAGYEEAERYVAKLRALSSVKEVIWLGDFVPNGQTEKLATLDDLSIIFLDSLEEKERKAPGSNYTAQRTALDQLIASLSHQEAHTSLHQHLIQFKERVIDDQEATTLFAALEHALLGGFPEYIADLKHGIMANRITLDNLPGQLTDNWQSPEKNYRLLIAPHANVENPAHLATFVDEISRVNPGAIGAPVFYVRAADAVIASFQKAFAYAIVAAFLLCLPFFRQFRDTLLIMGSFLLSALLTVSVLVLLDIPFNYANIIALPLLLGIGIDSAIHIMHRARNMGIARDILSTSSSRAILISSLTTLIGFGSLVFSRHPGTASLGMVLAIGLLSNMICALLVMPIFLPTHTHMDKKNA